MYIPNLQNVTSDAPLANEQVEELTQRLQRLLNAFNAVVKDSLEHKGSNQDPLAKILIEIREELYRLVKEMGSDAILFTAYFFRNLSNDLVTLIAETLISYQLNPRSVPDKDGFTKRIELFSDATTALDTLLKTLGGMTQHLMLTTHQVPYKVDAWEPCPDPKCPYDHPMFKGEVLM